MSRAISQVMQPVRQQIEIQKWQKSPLRYPGGKSRAAKKIIKIIPNDINTICSPFFGGGSIELACAAQGIQVYGYDNFTPLVDFWQELRSNPQRLAKIVKTYYPLTRNRFYSLQKEFKNISDSVERAAAFYALNRASFSGTTLSGGMSPNHPRFTEKNIEYITNFNSNLLNVKQADFEESITNHDDDFLYLDPPYANGGALYGIGGNMHKDFDHARLANMLKKRLGWLLSYNDCDTIRDLYSGYKMTTPEWAYGMNSNKKSKELLIFSQDFMRVN